MPFRYLPHQLPVIHMNIFTGNEILFTTSVHICSLQILGQKKSRKQDLGSFGAAHTVRAGVTASYAFIRKNIMVRSWSSGARLSRFKMQLHIFLVTSPWICYHTISLPHFLRIPMSHNCSRALLIEFWFPIWKMEIIGRISLVRVVVQI